METSTNSAISTCVLPHNPKTMWMENIVWLQCNLKPPTVPTYPLYINSSIHTFHSEANWTMWVDILQTHQKFLEILQKSLQPGHRVPRFSSINWAICVPSACTAQDVKMGLRETLDGILDGTELSVQVEVDPGMCQRSNIGSLPRSTIIVRYFCIFVNFSLITPLFSVSFLQVAFYWLSLQPFMIIWVWTGKVIEKLHLHLRIFGLIVWFDADDCVLAFSLRKNFQQLVSMKRSTNDIEVLHGIRFINAFMLLIAHKCMALMFVPYVNRTQMSEVWECCLLFFFVRFLTLFVRALTINAIEIA